jgi:hypothetical protein
MAQTSSMQYFLAVTLWVAAWWVIDIVNGDPIGLFLAVLFAIVGWGMALGAIRAAVPARSPFTSTTGRILWSLRPRAWVIAWAGICLVILVLGEPLFLWTYGGGQCRYFDWHGHWITLPAHGDGSFGGCRFLRGR